MTRNPLYKQYATLLSCFRLYWQALASTRLCRNIRGEERHHGSDLGRSHALTRLAEARCQRRNSSVTGRPVRGPWYSDRCRRTGCGCGAKRAHLLLGEGPEHRSSKSDLQPTSASNTDSSTSPVRVRSCQRYFRPLSNMKVRSSWGDPGLSQPSTLFITTVRDQFS